MSNGNPWPRCRFVSLSPISHDVPVGTLLKTIMRQSGAEGTARDREECS